MGIAMHKTLWPTPRNWFEKDQKFSRWSAGTGTRPCGKFEACVVVGFEVEVVVRSGKEFPDILELAFQLQLQPLLARGDVGRGIGR